MTCGARHAHQRSNRVRLKADAVVLLDRIAARMLRSGQVEDDRIMLEIAEMRLRFSPAPGLKAPIVRTGYTNVRKVRL